MENKNMKKIANVPVRGQHITIHDYDGVNIRCRFYAFSVDRLGENMIVWYDDVFAYGDSLRNDGSSAYPKLETAFTIAKKVTPFTRAETKRLEELIQDLNVPIIEERDTPWVPAFCCGQRVVLKAWVNDGDSIPEEVGIVFNSDERSETYIMIVDEQYRRTDDDGVRECDEEQIEPYIGRMKSSASN